MTNHEPIRLTPINPSTTSNATADTCTDTDTDVESGRCNDGCCAPDTAPPAATIAATMPVLPAARRVVLTRRVRLLVAATITYNVIEAIVAISAGAIADSTALIGFGLDSIIEVASAAAVAWQF